MGSRSYYRKVHGFDPDKDKIYNLERTSFRFEAAFPLRKDIAFHNSGVNILARVEVEEATGRVQNKIVFQKGNKETTVNCIHTAVFEMKPDDALDLLDNPEKVVELARTTEKKPISLTPEEHFASLKSFVAGIAELGVVNILNAAYISPEVNPETLPFGFNADLQKQMIYALRHLIPNLTMAILRDMLIQLAYTVTPDWFDSRLQLLDSMYDVKGIVCSEPDLYDLLTAIVPSPNLRLMCANHPETHEEILSRLATDESDSVRIAVAGNPALTPQLGEVLLNDNTSIRETLTLNPRIPPRLLEILARAPETKVKLAVQINPNVTPSILQVLARDGDPQVRRMVAQHQKKTPETTQTLALSPDPSVRIRLLERGEVPLEILATFARDENPHVKYSVAKYLQTPATILEEILKNANRETKMVILAHPNVNPSILVSLATDFDHTVRAAVAASPHILHGQLRQLLTDIDFYVRLIARRNPLTKYLDEFEPDQASSWEFDATVLYCGEFLSYEEARALGELQEGCSEQIIPLPQSATDQVGFVARNGHIIALNLIQVQFLFFPDVWESLPHLEALRLVGLGVHHLQDSIVNLRALRVLQASKNHLSDLPKSLGSLQNLQILDLSENDLCDIPHSIAKLQYLEELDLSSNNIRELSFSFEPLANLKRVKLHQNPWIIPPLLPSTFFEQLRDTKPDVNSSKELDVLSLIELLLGRSLLSLPEIENRAMAHRVGYTSKNGVVIALYLSSWSKLPCIPPQITNLDNLEVLVLRNTTLRALPDEICTLEQLKILDLSNNCLVQLPGDFGNLSRLQVLDLSENQLSEFPASIQRLSLSELNLSNNRIHPFSLPETWIRSLKNRGCRISPVWLNI